jgi:hypothetical protein
MHNTVTVAMERKQLSVQEAIDYVATACQSKGAEFIVLMNSHPWTETHDA